MEQVAFLEILTFVAGALLFLGIGSWINALLQPQRTNEEMLSTYESGEEAIGNTWGKFNTPFYGIAIIFLFFEMETVLLFPCTAAWAKRELNEATGGLWMHYTAISITLFVALLAVGLIYVWSQGHLANIQPPIPASSVFSKVPQALYNQFNQRYASIIMKKKYTRDNYPPTTKI